MLSRVADNLYWMRRYVERADQIARVVAVNLDLAFDRAPGDVARLWGRLLPALWSAPAWATVDRAADGEALTDLSSIDAVASSVVAARENARQVRQNISAEMWERLNGAHLALSDPARRRAWADRPHAYFHAVRESAALFDAAIDAGMPRDEGWHFVRLGLFLERASGTTRLLRCQVQASLADVPGEDALDEQLEWICLLRACDALELYRRRCGAALDADRIVRFLVADPLSPRSLRYALDEIDRALSGLAGRSDRSLGVSPDVSAAVESIASGAADAVVVPPIEAECDRIHAAVYARYIDHRLPAEAVANGEVSWTAR